MKTWTVTFSLDADRRLNIESTDTEFKHIEKMGMLEILRHNLVKESFMNREEETR